MRPQRHGGRGERYADADIPARRKGPVEGRAQVVEVGPVRNEPLGGGPRLQLGLGMLKEIAIVLAVASRKLVELGALDELFTSVGARRLEQAIAHDLAGDIRRQE